MSGIPSLPFTYAAGMLNTYMTGDPSEVIVRWSRRLTLVSKIEIRFHHPRTCEVPPCGWSSVLYFNWRRWMLIDLVNENLSGLAP